MRPLFTLLCGCPLCAVVDRKVDKFAPLALHSVVSGVMLRLIPSGADNVLKHFNSDIVQAQGDNCGACQRVEGRNAYCDIFFYSW